MQRDMDLLRELLLIVEAIPAGAWTEAELLTVPGYPPVVVQEHLRLLWEAGLIVGDPYPLAAGPPLVTVQRLTWAGHDFLAGMKKPEIWSRVKAILQDKAVSLPVELLGELLLKLGREHVGLPPS